MASSNGWKDGAPERSGGNSTRSSTVTTDARRVSNGSETLVSLDVEHSEAAAVVQLPEDIDEVELDDIMTALWEQAEDVLAGDAVVVNVGADTEGSD